jgi:hypothetical protein
MVFARAPADGTLALDILPGMLLLGLGQKSSSEFSLCLLHHSSRDPMAPAPGACTTVNPLSLTSRANDDVWR